MSAGSPTRAIRSDAAANQERVLAAAITAVQREGTNVPLATIAAEAGVGVGTLYRRYPNREALYDALAIRAYTIIADALDEIHAAGGTGIHSLERFLERTIAHRTQLVLPFHGAPSSSHPDALRGQAGVHQRIARMLRRGRSDGTIRADLRVVEVVVFGAMISQPLPAAADWDPMARRQVQIFLRGARP